MASSKEYLDFILEQLSELDDITVRAMMGEFIIYYCGKIVGGIYNNHRYAKTIVSSIVFAAKRQVWQPMIQRIIGAMFIAMSIWQNSTAVLRSSKAARRNAFWRFAII